MQIELDYYRELGCEINQQLKDLILAFNYNRIKVMDELERLQDAKDKEEKKV